MNDAHDNAQADQNAHVHAVTTMAIEAFRKQELKRLQLEMAEHALTKLITGRPRIDTTRYYEETEQIRHQMELKRADYERLGKLPRDTHVPAAKPAAGAALPATDHCPTCRKVHKAPEVVTKNGVQLWPGHEYIIRTLVGTQKLYREWRMGYLGFGYGTEWSARGPDRTHGDQYGGTQHVDLRDIVFAEEIERDDRMRHVGMTEVELTKLRRRMTGATLPARAG